MNRIRSIQIDDELWPLLGKMAQANGISREMMVDRLIRPILIHEENKVKRNPIANLRKKAIHLTDSQLGAIGEGILKGDSLK